MDKRGQGAGGSDETDPAERSVRDVAMTLHLVICSSTLVLLALAEQFAQLPAVLVANASAWFIMRL